MASALPVAFRTLFTCLFIYKFGFCAKNKFFFSSSVCLASVFEMTINLLTYLLTSDENILPTSFTVRVRTLGP